MTYDEIKATNRNELPVIYLLIKTLREERNLNYLESEADFITANVTINVSAYGHKKIQNDSVKYYKHISLPVLFLFFFYNFFMTV